jgi:hypothetical protein
MTATGNTRTERNSGRFDSHRRNKDEKEDGISSGGMA